jgi:hypothetical protein
MKQAKLTFDVLSRHRANHPIYRLYVNNDLIVERTYGLPPDQYLRENLVVNLPVGQHTLRAECPGSSFHNNFELRGFQANGVFGTMINDHYVFVVDESFPAAA